MKINQLRYPIISSTLLCMAFIQSHICQIDLWKAPQSMGSSIYIMHDFHVSNHTQNKVCNKQRTDIINYAKKSNGLVIVEDMHMSADAISKNAIDYNPNMHYSNSHSNWLSLEQNNEVSPIVGMTAFCQKSNVPVINVEFRHAGNASDDGLPVSASDCLAITKNLRNEIAMYDDGDIYNQLYRNGIMKYDQLVQLGKPIFDQMKKSGSKNLKTIQPHIRYNISVDQLLRSLEWSEEEIRYSDNNEKIDFAINHYDRSLLDLKTIHEISCNKQHPYIFVCVGMNHADNINSMLTDIGYMKLHTVQKTYKRTQFGYNQEPNALNIPIEVKNLISTNQLNNNDTSTQFNHSYVAINTILTAMNSRAQLLILFVCIALLACLFASCTMLKRRISR